MSKCFMLNSTSFSKASTKQEHCALSIQPEKKKSKKQIDWPQQPEERTYSPKQNSAICYYSQGHFPLVAQTSRKAAQGLFNS